MDPSEALAVVVVDDEESARSVVACAVRALGHDCREAADGAEAWAMLQVRPADVVISDWQMPGMTGPELCLRARTESDEGYTYFILLTAFNDRAHLLEGMAAGADDFQKKPVDLDELEARLVSATRVVGLHRRLAARTENLRRDSTRFRVASETDTLTGVGSRLRMTEELSAAMSRADRYGHGCSIAMFDVDYFKQFNDAFGHLAGDDALRSVADAARARLRSSDAIYRYGGEEFVVILPEQPASDAAFAVERVRAAVEALAVAAPNGVLTVSAGVAELDRRVDETAEEWLARADAALYEAKRSGKNRVCVAAPIRGVSLRAGA